MIGIEADDFRILNDVGRPPDRALEFGRFLITRTRLLAEAPALGRVVPEVEDPFIREIIVRSYRVVYRLDHTNHLVEVIRFWHAARGAPEIGLLTE